MNKSYIPEVARMLGVEIGEEFDVLDSDGDAKGWNPHRFTEKMMVDCVGGEPSGWLAYYLLTGEYTIQKHPWRPKDEEIFWLVLPDGRTNWGIFRKNKANGLSLLNMGNCFPTKEAAEAAVPEMLAKFEEIKKGVWK
jgi:hypothetical protein